MLTSVRHGNSRGSGLILALGVLALLAIMATTFITLMRIQTRLAVVYTDDLRAELLTAGVANYTLAVLRDDLDRTIGRYANRTTVTGGRGSWQGMNNPHAAGTPPYAPGDPNSKLDFRFSVPGRNTDGDPGPQLFWDSTAGAYVNKPTPNYGTVASRAVWFTGTWETGQATGLNNPESLYEGNFGTQISFGGGGFDFVICDKNDQIGAPNARYYAYVLANHNSRDDDVDGWTDPDYSWDGTQWYYPGAATNEVATMTGILYDSANFLTGPLTAYIHPGGKFTGDFKLPGGLYWRWATKMGIPEEQYLNLNATGNLDLSTAPGRLTNMDGLGLNAYCAANWRSPGHLGMLSWKGYPGEYQYTMGGFPRFYFPVQYSPYQVDPYRLLTGKWSGLDVPPIVMKGGGGVTVPDTGRAQTIVTSLVQNRWGGGTGVPTGMSGTVLDQWRVGWRRDGATYYKFPTPDNPQGQDRYFGVSEALNHQSEDIMPGTSRVLQVVSGANGGDPNWTREDFGRMRSYLSTFGSDTILRGKIWPTEGPPYTSRQGDWRHIDILKRVNLNIIGADGVSDGLANEDMGLKGVWASKAQHERDRLYYMLRAMLLWSGTGNPQKQACQFIASLTDLIGRGNNESVYIAPDGLGTCALGVKKFPVINEIAFLSERNANKDTYELSLMRVEFYNPAANVPWIRDVDEAYDISNYRLMITSTTAPHEYRVGDMRVYDSGAIYLDRGPVGKIGADGMYGNPSDVSPTHQTWSRFIHAGWSTRFPSGVTKSELEGGLVFSLYKPLTGPAAAAAASGILSGPGVRQLSDGQWYICVDQTDSLKLVKTYTAPKGPGDPSLTYVGVYRKFDPMNAKVYGTQGQESSNVVWAPGYSLESYATLGRPNTGYPTVSNPSVVSGYGYRRAYEREFVIVNGDLPSVGWLGEVFLKNCAQDGPLTRLHRNAQDGIASPKNCSDLEGMKLDLYQPFGKGENLHLYEMFTVWDPSNDGIDNDGDGVADEQFDGDRGGGPPELRVYGQVDINHAGNRTMATIQPEVSDTFDSQVEAPRTKQGIWHNRERGRAPSYGESWEASGPRDSIGDLLRMDDIVGTAGMGLSAFTSWSVTGSKYCPYVGSPIGTYYGAGVSPEPINIGGTYKWGTDDDQDGISNNREERDFMFTQMANYMTTRDNTFTVEIVGQICEPPYYPGKNYRRRAYKTTRVYAQRHLILLVDRTSALRVNSNGTCEFTGPIRILAQRWSHDRH